MMNSLYPKLAFLRLIGAFFIAASSKCGRFFIFLLESLVAIFRPPFYFRILLRQVIEIGYYSLPVIGLTAIFTGAVLALQSYTGFSRMNAANAVASIVALSITRELGPVLGGLMLAGRIAAAIAAEIGTMRVTEQIDAFYTLRTNPMQYLIAPRVLASILVLPILVLVADIVGIFGGYLVAVHKLNFISSVYLSNTMEILEFWDIFSGLVKAVAFGLIVSVVGCFFGYFSKGGAQGVGNATTSAVVFSSIMILLANYIITGLLFVK